MKSAFITVLFLLAHCSFTSQESVFYLKSSDPVKPVTIHDISSSDPDFTSEYYLCRGLFSDANQIKGKKYTLKEKIIIYHSIAQKDSAAIYALRSESLSVSGLVLNKREKLSFYWKQYLPINSSSVIELWQVQYGAFKSYERAKNLQDKIEKNDVKAGIYKKSGSDVLFYVCSEELSDIKKAESLKNLLGSSLTGIVISSKKMSQLEKIN
jgi:hypothetical protein